MLIASTRWAVLLDTSVGLLLGLYFSLKGFGVLKTVEVDWRLSIFRIIGPVLMLGAVIGYAAGFMRAFH
jgi:hypothetical protein